MSLVRCKECGKKVSSKAKKCVKCGAPLEIVDEKTLLEIKVMRSKKVKKIILIVIGIIGVILGLDYFSSNFLPNGEKAYYCEEGYSFYAIGKICYDGKKQHPAKIKILNNHLRYNSDISFQFVFDENNEQITFMGDNCYGRWSDDVKTTFCYGYEDMSMFEEFNKMNDYKNLSKVDQVLLKINGVWSDSTTTDGSKFTFYPDNNKCEVSDTGNRWKTSSCDYNVYEDKIEVSFEFTDPSKKTNTVSFNFNEDVTELYRNNFIYTKVKTKTIKNDGQYICQSNGNTIVILENNEVNFNKKCVPCASLGYCCPSYGGTYVIDDDKLKATFTRDYIERNKYLNKPMELEFTITNENKLMSEKDNCIYEWEPFGFDYEY